MLPAANFKFTMDKGVVYGFFASAGLQALELRAPDAPAPVLLHSMPNVVLGRTLHRLLESYFARQYVSFEAIPLDTACGTTFQQQVWQAARTVPYGRTTSYGRLAAAMGRPGAARAVGNALGANPIILLTPCHRVLAADGGLGGYSSGLAWKRYFLDIECASIDMNNKTLEKT